MQHTDLHPGNILVRVRPSGGDKDGDEEAVANIDDVLLRPIAKGQARAQLQLVSDAVHHLENSCKMNQDPRARLTGN